MESKRFRNFDISLLIATFKMWGAGKCACMLLPKENCRRVFSIGQVLRGKSQRKFQPAAGLIARDQARVAAYKNGRTNQKVRQEESRVLSDWGCQLSNWQGWAAVISHKSQVELPVANPAT